MLTADRLRAAVVAAFVTVVTAGVAGCSAGFDAASTETYAPADGILADAGSIRVQNALVVAAEGATSGVVSMAVVNRGNRPEAIIGITSNGGTVEITGDAGIPAGGVAQFGSATGPAATITDLSKAPGQTIRLQLSFQNGESVSLRTVVVPAAGDYASFTPAATPSPSLETPAPGADTP